MSAYSACDIRHRLFLARAILYYCRLIYFFFYPPYFQTWSLRYFYFFKGREPGLFRTINFTQKSNCFIQQVIEDYLYSSARRDYSLAIYFPPEFSSLIASFDRVSPNFNLISCAYVIFSKSLIRIMKNRALKLNWLDVRKTSESSCPAVDERTSDNRITHGKIPTGLMFTLAWPTRWM